MADVNAYPTGDGGAKRVHKTIQKADPQTISIASDKTVGNFTICAWALTHTIVVVLPDWTNSVTATLSIENDDSNEIYSVASLAKDSTHVIAVEKPLVGTNTVIITLSGVPGGTGGDTETTLYLQ